MQHLTCETTADLLRGARRVLLGGHIRPDGDCLGAMAALGLALRARGASASMLVTGPIPARYHFLAHHFSSTLADDAPDLLVVLDTSDRPRIALPAAALACGAPLLVIDHHAAGAHQCDFLWCDASCGAASCMVYDLLNVLQCEISPAIAEALYTGILTDTGCFTYPNADERIFALALRLVQHGLDTARIARDIYQCVSLAATRLLGAALNTLQCHANNRIAIMHVSCAMLRETGAVPADIEDLINVARAIDSVAIAALITEQDDGTVRISVRSKDSRINVGQLALRLGGGGHACAAGATLPDTLPAALARLPGVLHSFLEESVSPTPLHT